MTGAMVATDKTEIAYQVPVLDSLNGINLVNDQNIR